MPNANTPSKRPAHRKAVLRALRARLGLTQIELAERIGWGREGQSRVSDLERDSGSPPGLEVMGQIGVAVGHALVYTADSVRYVPAPPRSERHSPENVEAD